MINKKQGHEYLIFLQLNFNSDAYLTDPDTDGFVSHSTTGPELNVVWMGK